MKTVIGLRLQRVEERLRGDRKRRQRIKTAHMATPIRAVGCSPLREEKARGARQLRQAA